MKTQSLTKALSVVLLSFVSSLQLLNAQSFNASIFESGNNQCSNAFIQLIAIPGDAQSYTYEWTCPGGNCPGGSNTVSSFGFISNNDLSQSGIYTVMITENSSGDTSSASVNVVIRPIPEVSISYDDNQGCAGDTINVTASDGANGSNLYGPYTYLWSNGVSTSVLTTTIAATSYPFSYDVVMTNSYGCTAVNQNGFWVFGNPVPVISIASAGPTEFCYGGNSALTATVDYDTSLVTLQWKKYSSFLSNTDHVDFNATMTGRYRCVATLVTPFGCKTTSNFIDVTVNPLPQVSISPSGPLGACPNQPLVLEAIAPTAVSYQWKKYANILLNDTNITLATTKAGKYKVIVEDANGCSRSSATVELLPPPSNQVSVSGTLDLCPGESVTFTAAAGYSYQWKRYGDTIQGATLQTYIATTTGKYRVLVTNGFNCTVASQNFNVVVSPANCSPEFTRDFVTEELLHVYPNPFDLKLSISLPLEFGEIWIAELYDFSGKLVYSDHLQFESSQLIELNTSQIPPGVYLLKVVSNDLNFHKVVIRQ